MHLAIDWQFCHEIWLHSAGFCGLCSTTSMDPARHPEGQRVVWKWDERGAVQQMSGWVCSADGSWNSAWRWPDRDWGKGKLSVMQEDYTTFCIITALGCCMRECFLLWLAMQWNWCWKTDPADITCVEIRSIMLCVTLVAGHQPEWRSEAACEFGTCSVQPGWPLPVWWPAVSSGLSRGLPHLQQGHRTSGHAGWKGEFCNWYKVNGRGSGRGGWGGEGGRGRKRTQRRRSKRKEKENKYESGFFSTTTKT